MPIPEKELFIVLRELRAWLFSPLPLKTALQALFDEAERRAMEPLLPEVAELIAKGEHNKAVVLLRERTGISLADASGYVRNYANAIAGKPP